MGIADMLFGGAQIYPVPQPQVSMADLLAGQTLAPPPQGGSVATAYGDSPAPGAVAAAATEATMAGNQEPGILDTARNWAKTNPVQAQALMQGFAALASGRTHGNAIMQLGQGAGTAMQTVAEQNAANEAQQRAIQAEQQRQGLATRQEDRLQRTADSTIDLNQRQDKRAEASNAENIAASQSRRKATDLATTQSEKMFTPKMDEMRKRLLKLDQDIAQGGDDATIRKLNIQKAQLEASIHKQFALPEAQAILERKQAEAGTAQEKGVQAILETDEAARRARVLAGLTPEETKNLVMGTKPKAAADPAEIAKDLLNKNYELYQKPNGGGTDYARLAKDVNAAIKAGQPGAVNNARQEALDAARNSVPVGGRYIFEGVERTRSK
ncbi:MAG: hypothetical protein ACKOX6_00945 [Bdellovibrio sp.]